MPATVSRAASGTGARPTPGGSSWPAAASGPDFDAHFARGLASREDIVRGMDDATYHGIIGGAFYLVAGRKHA